MASGYLCTVFGMRPLRGGRVFDRPKLSVKQLLLSTIWLAVGVDIFAIALGLVAWTTRKPIFPEDLYPTFRAGTSHNADDPAHGLPFRCDLLGDPHYLDMVSAVAFASIGGHAIANIFRDIAAVGSFGEPMQKIRAILEKPAVVGGHGNSASIARSAVAKVVLSYRSNCQLSRILYCHPFFRSPARRPRVRWTPRTNPS